MMEPERYLTPRGKRIFERIAEHCKAMKKDMDAFSFEASMLANSLDLYHRVADNIAKGRSSYKQKTQTGWEQTTADYNVLTKEYTNIMKHAPKFGLNPKDMMTKIEKENNAEERITKLRKLNSAG